MERLKHTLLVLGMNGVPLEPHLVDSSRSALTSSSWIKPVLRVRDEVSAGLFYSHVSWEDMFAGWGIAQVLLLVKTPWGSRSNLMTTSLDSHGRLVPVTPTVLFLWPGGSQSRRNKTRCPRGPPQGE